MGTGGGNILGVLLAIQADPSQAERAIDDFNKNTENSLKNLANKGKESGEQLGDGILNAHHSAHLLLEELGIHLPRAVVGAIAEMLPNIAMLGGGLLGVFAVKQIFEVVGELKKASDEMNGLAEAERQMAEAST